MIVYNERIRLLTAGRRLIVEGQILLMNTTIDASHASQANARSMTRLNVVFFPSNVAWDPNRQVSAHAIFTGMTATMMAESQN